MGGLKVMFLRLAAVAFKDIRVWLKRGESKLTILKEIRHFLALCDADKRHQGKIAVLGIDEQFATSVCHGVGCFEIHQ